MPIQETSESRRTQRNPDGLTRASPRKPPNKTPGAMLTGPVKLTESFHPRRPLSMSCPNVGGHVAGRSACFRGLMTAFSTDNV